MLASLIYLESEELIPEPIITVPFSDLLNIKLATPDRFVTVKLLVILSFISTDKYPAEALLMLEYFGYEFISNGEVFIDPSKGMTGKFPKLEQPAPFSWVITKPL